MLADLADELKKDNKDLKKENKSLKNAKLSSETENNKLREALLILKDKLEETNVSNAKLLYINQTLGNASLNERQKQRVVEAISRSETANEAKTIYETLQGTVGTQDRASLPQSLSEAVSRKSSLLVAGRKATVTRENDSPVYDRMQRLAGLK